MYTEQSALNPMSIRLSKENQIRNLRLRLNSAFHQEIMTVARGIAWPLAPNIKDSLQTTDWTFNATRRQLWLHQAFTQATKKQAHPQLTYPLIARWESMGAVPDFRTVYSWYLHMVSRKLVCWPSPELAQQQCTLKPPSLAPVSSRQAYAKRCSASSRPEAIGSWLLAQS